MADRRPRIDHMKVSAHLCLAHLHAIDIGLVEIITLLGSLMWKPLNAAHFQTQLSYRRSKTAQPGVLLPDHFWAHMSCCLRSLQNVCADELRSTLLNHV